MMNLVLFGVFVFLLVAVQFAGGQTIDEIIEKHLRVKGGVNKIEEICDMYMEGIVTLAGNAFQIKISKERDEFNPSGFNMQWVIAEQKDDNRESVFDETMQISNVMAEIEPTPDMSQYLVNYASKGASAVLVAKELVEDNNCYHIKLITKNTQEIHFWINSSGFMLQQSCILIKPSVCIAGNNYVTYYNYQPVQGIQIARSIRMSNSADKRDTTCEILFSKVMVNQPFQPFNVKPAIPS